MLEERVKAERSEVAPRFVFYNMAAQFFHAICYVVITIPYVQSVTYSELWRPYKPKEPAIFCLIGYCLEII